MHVAATTPRFLKTDRTTIASLFSGARQLGGAARILWQDESEFAAVTVVNAAGDVTLAIVRDCAGYARTHSGRVVRRAQTLAGVLQKV